MSPSSRKVVVSEAPRERLSVPIVGVGVGGDQTLVREIATRLDRDPVDEARLDRIEHDPFDYGTGGGQPLLRDLLAAVESAAPRP